MQAEESSESNFLQATKSDSSITLNGGTECDHTSKPRHSIVVYQCSEHANSVLEAVVERNVCEYVATVSSRLFCDQTQPQTTADLSNPQVSLSHKDTLIEFHSSGGWAVRVQQTSFGLHLVSVAD